MEKSTEILNSGCLQRFERRIGLAKLMDKYPDLGWPETNSEIGTRPPNEEIKQWIDSKFTKVQVEIYSLIHPDLGGMRIEDAAKKLGITISAAYKRLHSMRKLYPLAFRYETVTTAIEHQISNSHKSVDEMIVLSRIIAKSKQYAAKHKIPYDLSDDDYLEIIKNTCLICDKEGEHDGITKDGRHFKYNYLTLRQFNKGYTYCNCFPVCKYHQFNDVWKIHPRFQRMGF